MFASRCLFIGFFLFAGRSDVRRDAVYQDLKVTRNLIHE